MSGPWRHADLGIVDRSRPLRFSFDGRSYTGFAGDTLASALLGAGLRLVGRSFKYHRPRGIVAAGAEEPNALVRLGRGRLAEPNTQATRVELSDGLVAESQHHWPSLGFDVGAAIGLLKPFMPAGFYYKTFIGQRAWRLVEPFIRRAAGFGRVPEAPDPERYEKRYAQAHVVVVGAGPSGLAAAQAAAQSGARVLLIDDDERLTSETPAGLESVTWLPRTTVVGYYHNNFLVAL
ncbi:MAG: 2Fe-2S iron-sulfur cluster-binding protein, partial [Alphaproteobacteria bacterium]|nr:2Fe-2S iron-sulfur cluster-binding protein [Alphaproteobacteria bacterium]